MDKLPAPITCIVNTITFYSMFTNKEGVIDIKQAKVLWSNQPERHKHIQLYQAITREYPYCNAQEVNEAFQIANSKFPYHNIL